MSLFVSLSTVHVKIYYKFYLLKESNCTTNNPYSLGGNFQNLSVKILKSITLSAEPVYLNGGHLAIFSSHMYIHHFLNEKTFSNTIHANEQKKKN